MPFTFEETEADVELDDDDEAVDDEDEVDGEDNAIPCGAPEFIRLAMFDMYGEAVCCTLCCCCCCLLIKSGMDDCGAII